MVEYLKIGSLPKKVMNVMNEMPKMTMAMSLRSPILLKLAVCLLSSWLLYVFLSWTSQAIRYGKQKTTNHPCTQVSVAVVTIKQECPSL
jgi:hypothetical protein